MGKRKGYRRKRKIVVKKKSVDFTISTSEPDRTQDRETELTGDVEDVFSCSINSCHYKFTMEFLLKRHVLMSHAEKAPLTCGHCQRTFQNFQCLTGHVLSHDKELQLSVSNSKNKKKADPDYLHYEDNSSNNCFTCRLCQKVLKREAALYMHMRRIHLYTVVFANKEVAEAIRSLGTDA